MIQLNKQLIIIRGPVGAGKTSVVEAIRSQATDISIIDFDAFKRQIDNAHSSEWRRTIAFDTALYLCQRLMDQNRAIVVDIHSSIPEQLDKYIELSKKNGYKVTSHLLYPPLETCFLRAGERIVPDITYAIDKDMIRTYWNNTFFVENEPIYNDPGMTSEDIARAIINSL